jgi:hypothetical protein
MSGIFKPVKEEVTRNLREIYNEELQDLYSTLNDIIIKSESLR